MELDDLTSDVYGLSLKQPTMQQIQSARQRYQGQQRIVFYSDGSLIHMGTDKVSAAFGVVASVNVGTAAVAIGGRVAGYASSTIAELCGLLATIIISPRNAEVSVFIDNLTVVENFQILVKNRETATARQRIRSADAQWWAMVHYAYVRQGKRVSVHWVRGHAGNLGNEAADAIAKAAHRVDTGMWQLDPKQHHDMLCHASFSQRTADQDLRQILKLQSAVRHHYRWAYQQRTKEHIQDWNAVAWTPTLRIIHNNNPPKRLYTSLQDSQLRSHRVKKLHGMLPTLQEMKQRLPDVYDTAMCRRCEEEIETDDHLWNCTTSLYEQRQEWTEAVEDLNRVGSRAWRRAVQKWKKAKDEAESSGKQFNTACPTFVEAPTEDIWASLEGIQGIEDRGGRTGGATQDRPEEEPPKWTVKDVYRGLVPISLIDGWKRVFQTTPLIATMTATAFVSRLEEYGRTGLWNKRCEDTVAWEKSVGITAMSKRAKGRIDVGGHLRSGGDFSDLTRRRLLAPDVRETWSKADGRVLEHFLGRVKLNMMERLVGLKTNLLTLDFD
jgi:ribonuclease HI